MGEGRKQQHTTVEHDEEAGPGAEQQSPELAPLVEALLSAGPGRAAAAATLLELIRAQVMRSLRGHRVGDLADDLVNNVLVKILNAPDTFRGKHWGYLRVVIINEVRTALRKGARLLPTEDAAFSRQEAPELADPVEVEQRWTLLDRAHDLAVAARRPQDRAALESSWPQLKALIEDSTDIQTLVEQEVAANAAATPPVHLDPRKVQNRIYQAQKRCRDALTRTLDTIEAEGLWAAEDLALARQQLVALLRVAPSSPPNA